jgi:hypothetical protein
VINNLVNQRDAAMRGLEAGHYEVAFDQRDRGLPPAGHGGWISAPDADPRLSQYRSAAMRTIDSYQRRSVLDSTAADRLDEVLRSGDPAGHTARYLSAVGNDHYKTAFGKLLRDPMQGQLRFGPWIASRRSATESRSSSSRSVYRSSVMAPDAWPSMRWTALTFAPADIARLAPVWRSSCGVELDAPMALAAASNQSRRALRLRRTPPFAPVNTRSSGERWPNALSVR